MAGLLPSVVRYRNKMHWAQTTASEAGLAIRAWRRARRRDKNVVSHDNNVVSRDKNVVSREQGRRIARHERRTARQDRRSVQYARSARIVRCAYVEWVRPL
ncbi:unnamed protein product, partial [Iphiclides podalirius]